MDKHDRKQEVVGRRRPQLASVGRREISLTDALIPFKLLVCLLFSALLAFAVGS